MNLIAKCWQHTPRIPWWWHIQVKYYYWNTLWFIGITAVNGSEHWRHNRVNRHDLMNGEPSHLYKGHHKNLGPPNHSQDYSQNKNYTGPELQWFCSNSEYTVPYFMSYTYMYEQNSTILQLEGTIKGQGSFVLLYVH